MKSLSFRLSAVATAVFLAMSGTVQAQAEADDAAAEATEIEEITVTGSRLRRDSFNVSTPLAIIDAEAIEDTGLGSLAEVLTEDLPAIFEGASNTNSQSLVNATGITTMSLRNQGNDRTLVLIDGRRTVPNQYSSNGVSLNSIPTALIQRVEIITGGSSAAYGSDAIAGVVNIITQTDKVGLEIGTRYGVTTNGGGEEVSFDVQFGTNYSGGRGYLFLAGTYDDQQGIKPFDRDRARIEADFDYNTTELCNEMQVVGGDECLRDIVGGPEVWRNRSDGIAGGVFEEGRGNGGYWYDENNVFRDDWEEERDGIYTTQFVQLKVPEDRYNLALKTTYDFENNIKGTFQVMWSEMNSFNDKSPEDEYDGSEVVVNDPVTLLPTGTITPGRISPDNPFVPQAIRDDVSSNDVDWERRMFEVGHITTDNKRTTLRGLFTLQGEFSDDWQWDTSISYGKSHQKQLRANEISVIRETQALDAEFAADGVTIQCADPVARAEGCVPLNIFGVGSITPEMADWLRVNPTIDSEIDQTQALAYVSGDLFEMSHGPVPAVFGIEYRRDSVNVRTDEGSRLGGITFNVIPTWAADYNVLEAFGEMAFPLTDNFSVEVSGRVADYSPSHIDTIFSYTTGVIWEVADGYRLRANYARAQRAPTLAELYSPPRGDYDDIDDICEGTTIDPALTPGRLYDNCRMEPGIILGLQEIQAALDLEGNGEIAEYPDEGNEYGPAAGNLDVIEETADTWTVGFSINPSWAENLRLAVDYWDISIEDKITEYENSEIMKQCYDSSQPWGDTNFFCNEISRHDDDGQLFQILNRQYNLDSGKARGLDLAMDYVFELGSRGNLVLELDYTHMFEDSDTYEGLDGLEVVDFTGQLDYGNFDDRATASFTWRYEDWRLRWTTKYKSSVADVNARLEDWDFYRTRNDERCATGDARCVANPEVPLYLYYPSYTKHDFSASYSMQTESIGTVRLFAGVRNVFDDMGPFMPTGGDTKESGPGNFDSKYDGGVGRFVYVGAEVVFD